MPSNVKLSEIKASLLQPALTSHFECDINIPPEVQAFSSSAGITPTAVQSNLRLSCCDTSLPGSSISTHELTNDFTGVTQKHAYRRLYDDRIDFTFYVDTTYVQIRFFERWLQYITGEQIADAADITNHYRVKFPKQYKSSKVSITKFERDYGASTSNKNVMGVRGLSSGSITYDFFNVFPLNINSMPVSYDNGQLLKCTVSMAYDRYNLNGLRPAGASNSSGADTNNQPQSSIPPGVFQNPNLQSTFNISQLSGLDYLSPSSFSQQANISNAFPLLYPI